MPPVADQLRQYATAMADPTRGTIVLELDRAGELTATQLARRLGLTANNVYHHMRVLLQLGVVDPPRAVPGETYVEKYYRINPDIHAALRQDPTWLDHGKQTMTAEDRKALLVSMCMTVAHLLRQAARRYEEMDAETLDELAHGQQLVLVSINELSRERLTSRLAALRQVLAREQEEYPEAASSLTDLVVLATLPNLWDLPSERET